ncbi:hypothetical protein EV694_1698 [Volucribacter psittacicida]|uniref:Phage neck terminator protein gp12-like domain-containing protein n=1 Tax=Volucribacter psittacicida TaxID=203482 RepID=A0A4R1FMC9_9PAST|nr:hypothetical protein [Volucribacter psittacicida]TCJ96146.1 hypothetical protein EV694_1698 [Volucribacter psittacicida]
MSAKLNITYEDIYREVRAFLLGLFNLHEDNVIRGYSNNVPLPNGDFILMNIINERALSTTRHNYNIDESSAEVVQTAEIMLQLDFYGENAAKNAKTFSVLWRDFYACERFSCGQPLYCDEPKFMQFINEASEYENRWTLTAFFNYNPALTHHQEFITSSNIEINQL